MKKILSLLLAALTILSLAATPKNPAPPRRYPR